MGAAEVQEGKTEPGTYVAQGKKKGWLYQYFSYHIFLQQRNVPMFSFLLEK